jgi:S1-C subfamily serine protease
VGQARPEPQASALQSPRVDAASIPALTGAVVYVQAPGSPVRRNRGFVIDGRGYVLTNDKVVRGARAIEVTLHDGRRFAAVRVAQDPLNDVAVLKVKATGLPAIALGDSQALAAGERVLLIGEGSSSNRALTVATIRATGVATGGNLAIDVPVSPQGSGGPLLNRFGQAVGIVTHSATLARETPRLTSAVPINRVKPILRQLLVALGPAVALGSER